MDAYLDIETTGLSPYRHRITIIGIVFEDKYEVVQMVGTDVTGDQLVEALGHTSVIHTYNGTTFDLPFICIQLGIDLTSLVSHRDLMLDCWKRQLYGGQKAVEQKLGILRTLQHVDGRHAIGLWNRYRKTGDKGALAQLLQYNREDVLNLRALKEALEKLPVKGVGQLP